MRKKFISLLFKKSRQFTFSGLATLLVCLSTISESRSDYFINSGNNPDRRTLNNLSYSIFNSSTLKAANAMLSTTGGWQSVTSSSGLPTARHEASYVQAGNKFYLMGGRRIKPVQVFDPINKTWINKSNTPIELHHFQAVTIDGLIYVVGAFTGSYPHETPVKNIYIYNPVSDKWIIGATIPQSRRRGSAGVVVYNNKIYLAGGIIDGHWSGHVNWLDEYNPATNTWRTLANAPRARDHFQAAVINNKLYLAAGRRSSASTNQTFNLTVSQVDVYDFATNKWVTLPSSSNIPTQRAGTATAVLGEELIIIGGESGSQSTAFKRTEALNVTTNTWRRLADLKQGRHGTQAIVNNNGIYIAAGCANRGGSPELNTQEAFYFDGRTTPTGVAVAPSKLNVPTSLNFNSVAVNSSSSKTVTLTNTGGNQAIIISSFSKTGASSFTYSSPYTFPFVIAPGKSVSISIRFNPTTSGSQSASLVIKHSGQVGSATIALSGTGGTSTTPSNSYAINAGGAAITLEGKNWNSDNYYNGGKIYTNTSIAAISNTNSDALYKTERSSSTPFNYSFPVAAGTYLVKLHFAEIYFGATGGAAGGTGKRVFSVNLEGGAVELLDYDIYREVGAMKAVIKSFNVPVTDGALNIDFTAKINQPKISAIEITKVSTTSSNTIATTFPANKSILPQSDVLERTNQVLLAYPNPVLNGQFSVNLPEKLEGEVPYVLVNQSGAVLATSKLNVVHPTSTLQFNFSGHHLNSGLYYLQLNWHKNRYFIKLLIQ